MSESSMLETIAITAGVLLAAGGGVLAAIAGRKMLALSESVAKRIETVEHRLLITQLRLISESIMSEAFYIDQISSTLKTSMIEDAIADGRHTSDAFNASIAVIDKRKAGVMAVQKEARARSEKADNNALMDQSVEQLSKQLGRAESQLVKLRQVKKHFEKKLEAYREGDQFFGDDTIQ
ncbi:MAG: hypothetical protein AAF420_01090 [Pseudomonadota bacterium]